MYKIAKKGYAKSKPIFHAISSGGKSTSVVQGTASGPSGKPPGRRRKFTVIRRDAQSGTTLVKHSPDGKVHIVRAKSVIRDVASGDVSQGVVRVTPFGSAGKVGNVISHGRRQGRAGEEADLAVKLVGEIERQGPDVESLCSVYDLKREELGRLTGFSLRALADWAGGKLPSQPAQRRLHEVRRLLDALSGIVKQESIKSWLHQPNLAFDRLTPLQVIELGEIDRLWAMVHELGSGESS